MCGGGGGAGGGDGGWQGEGVQGGGKWEGEAKRGRGRGRGEEARFEGEEWQAGAVGGWGRERESERQQPAPKILEQGQACGSSRLFLEF